MWKKWANRYSMYFTRRFYMIVSIIVADFILAFFYEALMQLGSYLIALPGDCRGDRFFAFVYSIQPPHGAPHYAQTG